MIRTLTIALAMSLPLTALTVAPAAAQVTEQTDKSEEDWRKSKKKRDASDIFEDILNTRSTGVGTNEYPKNPVDNLPEESRRHLMKERAKVIAKADLETVTSAPYVPSEAAKSDPQLAEQEKEAWTVIMTDLEGPNDPNKTSAGSGPHKIAVAGRGGSSSEPDSSPMRGGSSASVAEIMAQIKGMKSITSGNGQSGSSSAGTSSSTGGQSESPSSTQGAERDQPSDAAPSNASESAKNVPVTEPMSPLERIKAQRNSDSTGSQTSALDYLNKDKD